MINTRFTVRFPHANGTVLEEMHPIEFTPCVGMDLILVPGVTVKVTKVSFDFYLDRLEVSAEHQQFLQEKSIQILVGAGWVEPEKG